MNKETIVTVEKTINTMDRAAVMIKELSQQLNEANALIQDMQQKLTSDGDNTQYEADWLLGAIYAYQRKYKLIENK